MRIVSKNGIAVSVRRATEADAEAIAGIVKGVAGERIYTALDEPWPADQLRQYVKSLSPRETFHVAEADHTVVGYQSLDLYAPTIHSMAHVGQLGTFLKPEWRRHGIGEALFQATLDFARRHDFSKFVIQVRSSNVGAQGYYKRMGFQECGRLARQVRIGEQEDDEVLMEFFL